jgi:hypothetical protein
MDRDDQGDEQDFAHAASQPQAGFLREFVLFLRDNKKWWLAPMLVVLLVVGALVVVGGTAAAPFIYSLF